MRKVLKKIQKGHLPVFTILFVVVVGVAFLGLCALLIALASVRITGMPVWDFDSQGHRNILVL
jgi:hypothetical protein